MNDLTTPLHSIYTLSSLDKVQIEALRELNITNLADLLAYPPFRYARYIRAARDKLFQRAEVIAYVDDPHQNKAIDELLRASPDVLRNVGKSQVATLKKLGLHSVADLAVFAAVDEAEEIISRAPSEDSDPFAPSCVLPTCKKFSRNTKSYTSFFKEREIRALSVTCSMASRIGNLFDFGKNENKVIHLGYSASYLQEWVYLGVHLGEPQGSINLSMGQDTQVSMLDWRRAMRAIRAEDTRISERLVSTLFHQRAVDEVARATAEEHQYGATGAFGANAATAGSFVAAGALVGGVGGGISGALVGLSVDVLTGGATAGLGTLGGTVAGSAVGSVAGAAAGSIIASGATTLGFVETDVEGDRTVFATSGQNIQQRTIQNSSSIRSFWSNIVSQSVEEEQQTIRTDRLTNHNRIHALNAILFEVLNGYRVNISLRSFAPLLFLPFKPFRFNSNLLGDYWWIIRTLLKDKTTVEMLDDKYLRLTAAPSAIDQLEELPKIDEITTSKVTVKVNLDGSAISEFIRSATNVVIATVAGLGVLDVILETFRGLFDATKRDKVQATLVTTNKTIDLDRDSYDAENFVWTFSSSRAVEVASITDIRITNGNGEFEVFGVDVSNLLFDNLKASIKIRNKSDFAAAVPTLGRLEQTTTLASEFSVGGNSVKDLPWGIGDQLRAKFEGVEEVRAELEAQKLEIENAEQAEAVLLDFLNANRFTFTRLILQSIEPEQVMTVLEDVRIGDIDLSDVAGTTPIGFCANHVVLPMKPCQIGSANYDRIGVNTWKLEMILEEYEDLDWKDSTKVREYFLKLYNFLNNFVQSAAASGNGSVRENTLINHVQNLLQLLNELANPDDGGEVEQVDEKGNVDGAPDKPLATASSSTRLPINVVSQRFAILAPNPLKSELSSQIRAILVLLRTSVTSNPTDAARLCDHYGKVKASLANRTGEFLSSDEISLPSPAVFMEPILSNAKGAELYDMRRNSHYSLLESPGISDADPNVLRHEAIDQTPTVPLATLTLQAPPDMPLPGSLAAVLGEAGKLNLGPLVSSNAASLTGMLSNLSTMATELAKASASLTGDAQKQALASATEVAKQVGGIVSKALETPSAETPAPPPAATPSPQTQQAKAEVDRRAGEIDKGNGSSQQKKERKKTIGAATTPDDKRDYLFSITFLDMDRIPYVTNSFKFKLTLTLFELNDVIDINGGQPIDLDPNGHGFLFPERIPLTKGHKVKLSLIADIGGVLVPGAISVNLPDSPDIDFVCTMKSEEQVITAGTVKEAVDTAVTTSTFGVNGGVLLDGFLNIGANFPFKVAEVTANGAFKAVQDLKSAYNKSETTTDGETTTTNVTKTFKVTTPVNGWAISME